MSRKVRKILYRKMNLDFFKPPLALLAYGTREGVELGGSKTIISIDGEHNFYSEGNIYTEMSWGAFYDIEGLTDQIDTFTTKLYQTVRDDADALSNTIIESLREIITQGRLFYGILDTECDAFMNQNTLIPGLKLDPTLINTLMESHKKTRDEDLFPQLLEDERGINSIKITIQGVNKKNLYLPFFTLEELAQRLLLAKGFATGLVIASKSAANFFMMNDNIVFERETIPEFYIDQDCITVIELGIPRKKLFPISWFRLDIGIRSLETLELWNDIKDNPELQKVLEEYDNYITELIINKYKDVAVGKEVTSNFEEEFYSLTGLEKEKVLKDMAGAIRKLTKMYNE